MKEIRLRCKSQGEIERDVGGRERERAARGAQRERETLAVDRHRH